MTSPSVSVYNAVLMESGSAIIILESHEDENQILKPCKYY